MGNNQLQNAAEIQLRTIQELVVSNLRVRDLPKWKRRRSSILTLRKTEGRARIFRKPDEVFALKLRGIVEFGPLLAFTACLMNFEKLAHGSPQ